MVELISIHIPKTAGISFFHILLDIYGEGVVHDDGDKARDLTKAKVIHGHFHANKYLKKYPKAKWISWVRHPVTRLFSFYYHKIYADKIEVGSFEDFIEKDEMINEQTVFLAGKKLSDYFFIGIQEFFEKDLGELFASMNWPTLSIPRSNPKKIQIIIMTSLRLLEIKH